MDGSAIQKLFSEGCLAILLVVRDAASRSRRAFIAEIPGVPHRTRPGLTRKALTNNKG